MQKKLIVEDVLTFLDKDTNKQTDEEKVIIKYSKLLLDNLDPNQYLGSIKMRDLKTLLLNGSENWEQFVCSGGGFYESEYILAKAFKKIWLTLQELRSQKITVYELRGWKTSSNASSYHNFGIIGYFGTYGEAWEAAGNRSNYQINDIKINKYY